MSEATKPPNPSAQPAEAATEERGREDAYVSALDVDVASPASEDASSPATTSEVLSGVLEGDRALPDDAFLLRLLSRGEQLVSQRGLSTIPDGLWEEGSELHLQPQSRDWSNRKADIEVWTDIDDDFDIYAGKGEPFPGPWWLRPLVGLGLLTLVAVVWWRLPPDNAILMAPSRPTQKSQVKKRGLQGGPVLPLKRIEPPRVLPAHRLRPKGLPLRGVVARGRVPTSRPASRSAVTFRWFVRRGQRKMEGRNGMTLQADDEIRFAYQGTSAALQGAHILVVMLDAKGQISPIYPANKGVTIRLQSDAGARTPRIFWLPDGAVLDQSLLSERIYVCATHTPNALAATKRAVSLAFQNSSLRRLRRLPLPCLYQRSWLIHKQPKGR